MDVELNRRLAAQRLHDKILEEANSYGVSTGLRSKMSDPSEVVAQSVSMVEAYAAAQEGKGGPSARREKFTPKFWRKWNADLAVLEECSRKDVVQGIVIPKPKRIIRKPKRDAVAHSFGCGTTFEDYYNKCSYGTLRFGTSVKDLLSESVSQEPPAPISGSPTKPKSMNASSLSPFQCKGFAPCLALRMPPISDSLNLTKHCDIPPVEPVRRKQPSYRFPGAPRFPPTISKEEANGARHNGSSGVPRLLSSSASNGPMGLTRGSSREGRPSASPGHKFGTAEATDWIQERASAATPGPGTYQIERMFEDNRAPPTRDFEAVLKRVQTAKPGMITYPAAEMVQLLEFAVGCSREEHIKYGGCLDGMCGRRSKFEEVILSTNDRRRARGDEDNRLTQVALSLIDDCPRPFTALQMAVCTRDKDSIRKLAFVTSQVNDRESQHGHTSLHMAVVRCALDIVILLIEVFSEHIDVNAKDNNGDSCLHIACREGYEEIVSVLCDAGASPENCRNNSGQTPLEVARTHRICQIIEATQDKIRLEKSISKVHKKREKLAEKIEAIYMFG